MSRIEKEFLAEECGLDYDEVMSESQNSFDHTFLDCDMENLEAVILQHYLSLGYKMENERSESDPEWSFTIDFSSDYKRKIICVTFFENSFINESKSFHLVCETLSALFCNCHKHFSS